jgi:hypothetical protein
LAGDWGYVLFTSGSTDASFDGSGNYVAGSILEYVEVAYAGGGTLEGAIRLDAAAPYLHNCDIHDNGKGGVYAYNGANPRLVSNRIHHNTTPFKGGGVYAVGAALLSGNTIESNTVTGQWNNSHSYYEGYGGGVYAEGATLSANTFTGNAVNLNYSNYRLYVRGGGVYLLNGQLVNNTLQGNRALAASSNSGCYAYGGGAYLAGSGTHTGNTLRGNVAQSSTSSSDAYSYGGGLYATGHTLSSNTVTGNQATASGYYNAYAYGGGVYAGNSTLNGETVILNSATATNSRAYYTYYGAQAWGGGVYAPASSVQASLITTNTLSGGSPAVVNGGGGGLYLSGGTASANTVSANTAQASGGVGYAALLYGAGLYADNAALTNNEVSRNTATSTDDVLGAGVYLTNAGNFQNNLVWRNSGTAQDTVFGTGIYYASGGSYLFLHNTVASNTAAGTCRDGGMAFGGGNPLLTGGNNFFDNAPYNLGNNTATDIQATENYWGSAEWALVELSIYDKDDDSAKGIVRFVPFRTSPDPQAPAVPGLALHASQPLLEATLPTNGREVKPVTIFNVGTQPAAFAVEGSPAAWLRLEGTGGAVAAGGQAGFSVILDATGLASGAYSAEVAVTGEGLPDGRVAFPVTLTVTPGNGYRSYLPAVGK